MAYRLILFRNTDVGRVYIVFIPDICVMIAIIIVYNCIFITPRCLRPPDLQLLPIIATSTFTMWVLGLHRVR